MMRIKAQRCIALGMLLLVIGGCQSNSASPLKSTAQVVGFATTPPESKDFVRETRRGEQPFIPVGSRIERDARKMTPQEFKSIEGDLDQIRARNEKAGAAAKAAGATPPPAPIKLTN
jgi:hypothetical protein